MPESDPIAIPRNHFPPRRTNGKLYARDVTRAYPYLSKEKEKQIRAQREYLEIYVEEEFDKILVKEATNIGVYGPWMQREFDYNDRFKWVTIASSSLATDPKQRIKDWPKKFWHLTYGVWQSNSYSLSKIEKNAMKRAGFYYTVATQPHANTKIGCVMYIVVETMQKKQLELSMYVHNTTGYALSDGEKFVDHKSGCFRPQYLKRGFHFQERAYPLDPQVEDSQAIGAKKEVASCILSLFANTWNEYELISFLVALQSFTTHKDKDETAGTANKQVSVALLPVKIAAPYSPINGLTKACRHEQNSNTIPAATSSPSPTKKRKPTDPETVNVSAKKTKTSNPTDTTLPSQQEAVSTVTPSAKTPVTGLRLRERVELAESELGMKASSDDLFLPKRVEAMEACLFPSSHDASMLLLSERVLAIERELSIGKLHA